ncbi:MAG TPA: GAF domain-containing protein [Anaerolineales bacterium]|nr:GAF domain-containing protein [Anaerolineales bacterium]
MKKNMLPPASRFMLLFATVISLLGQGFWLAPGRFEFILKYLSAVGNIIPGGVFLTLAWLLYIQSLRRIRLSQERIKRQTETLLFIQFIAAVGTLLLLKDLPAETKQTGFLLSGAITLLTSIGLYLNFSIPGREDKSGEGSGSFDLIAEGKETDALRTQIESLNERLAGEKHRNTQLTFLNELSKQLEAELELEVAAQLAVNTLAHAIDSSFASLLWHEPENKRYVMLTAAGKDIGTIPPGYQQDSTRGVLGRTTRLKKTQIVHDTRADADFLPVDSFTVRSMISVPILQHSKIRSVIEICSDKVSAFSSGDISIAEDVALELTRSWERVSYHQRLKELIQAGISLTTLLDPQAAVQEVALIAQRTLEARFVFVTLLDQQGNFSRMAAAGDAPRLFASLSQNSTNEPIIQAALNAARPFRIRDIRKYAQPGKMDADTTSLRSALAIPIRLHRLSIGTIIAFGKQDGVSFSENDESLADLMSSQAAASIESSWLYQELRNTLNTTSMLYQLSVDVIQAEELSDAAELIAQAAHKLTSASETGITLLSKSGNIEAEVGIDVNGFHNRREHPQTSINQAIQTGQSIIISNENGSIVCYPLLTMSGTYGALWMNIPESRGQNFANLQTLANQAAIALERAILLAESRRQAEEIKRAYAELETTYDRTLTSLMSALDARDRETEGHSVRVSRLACTLAKKLGLSEAQLKSLERGALLHDIGKIGISDTILHKPEKLTDDEWKIMRVHPDIGARIVEGIPFLNDAVPLIRHHHERWDGSGYPAGLRGKEIPTQARIFAVADVFDALTSRRRYREKSTPDEALQFMKENAGVLFDPDIIDTLTRISHHEFIESANAQ